MGPAGPAQGSPAAPSRGASVLTGAGLLLLTGTAVWASRLREAHGPGWARQALPEALAGGELLGLEAWQWLGLTAALLAAWIAGRLGTKLGLAAVRHVTRRTSVRWDDEVVRKAEGPVQLFAVVAAFGAAVEPLEVPEHVQGLLDSGRRPLLIVATAWLCFRLVSAVAAALESTLKEQGAEAQSRGSRTQVRVLHRFASAAIVLVASALVLTEFELVRKVGMSLLASAGIAGVVLGFAAQRSISTLLAGIQLTLTQPVRIGDTVIVEGEWGTVEEIQLTYLVVKIWDLRRLVVPITYFLERPFQNWTKVDAEILGSVELHADPSVPTQAVRDELRRLCESSPLWDRKVCGLQVTEAQERTIVLRALVSSADAGKNWDLRCELREKLVAYLNELEGGRFLPRVRFADGPRREVAPGRATG